MFFVAHKTRECTLHPSFFNNDASKKVIERLYTDMQGTIEGPEMIVQIIEVDEISDPVLVPGTGMAKYTLAYRAIVWRPFRGEVVDGMVSSVVSNGFFVDVGALNVFVAKAMIPPHFSYNVEGSTPSFADNTDQIIERGTQIRLRLKGIRGEMGTMYAIGSIREDYLGPLLQ